jgi:serine/threonine-protein kinase
MSPEQNQSVRQLFDKALEQPETQRLAFVAASCGGDMTVYQSVVRLLDAHKEAPSFLQDRARTQERMGRYLVTAELGRGAMGIVYDAVDPLIGRNVALKIIHFQAVSDSKEIDFLRDRLFREARAAGKLFHPGIVVILDVGQEGETAYIAMERVEGTTLLQLLATSDKLPTAQVIDILRQTASALDYAHQNGVVHRDIKPGNIMLHKGNVVKVADFGIAKSTATAYGTIPGMMLGTPSYMSPEQIEAAPVDGRSDQFALAVVAFEMLSGTRPFQGDSIATLAHMIAYGPRPSLRTANPMFGPAVDEVLHRALARSPKDRYATCMEFVSALDEALNRAPEPPPLPSPSDAPTAALEAPPAKTVQYPSTAWVKYVLGAAGLVTIGIAASLYWIYKQPVKKAAAPVAAPQTAAQVATPKVAPPVSEPPTASAPAQVPAGVTPAQPAPPKPDTRTLAKQYYNSAMEKKRAGQLKAAVPLFQQAANLGEVRAMEELGELYLEDGPTKNEKEAARWFHKAADAGSATGMLYLGSMYTDGTGVTQSDDQAAHWWGKAADAGNAAGMYDLGTLYEEGRGVPRSAAKAKELYQKAANLGNDEAKKRLAHMQPGR